MGGTSSATVSRYQSLRGRLHDRQHSDVCTWPFAWIVRYDSTTAVRDELSNERDMARQLEPVGLQSLAAGLSDSFAECVEPGLTKELPHQFVDLLRVSLPNIGMDMIDGVSEF